MTPFATAPYFSRLTRERPSRIRRAVPEPRAVTGAFPLSESLPVDQSLDREIRRLYSSFHSPEDRQGRSFVPLADAYRRAGDLLRARLLLEEGLRRHPGFSSAHVVAMRIARDVSDHAGALAATRRVLELDPDNVEARQVLAMVGPLAEDAGSPVVSGSESEGDAELPDESWMAGDAGVWAAGTDSGLASVDPVALEAEEEAAAADAGEGPATAADAEEEPATAAEVEEESPATAEGEKEPATAADAGDEPPAAGEVEAEPRAAADAGEEQLTAADAEEEEATAAVEAEAEEEEAIAAVEAEEEGATAAVEAEVDQRAAREAEEQDAAAETGERAAPVSTKRAVRSTRSAGIPVATPANASDAVRDAGIYTRTMGQLYEQQGLHAQAIAVYERLIESEPDDEALVRRLAHIRRQARDEASRTAPVQREPGEASSGLESPRTEAPPDDERSGTASAGSMDATREPEPARGGVAAKTPVVDPEPGDGLPVVPIEALAPDAHVAGAREETL